MFDRIARIEGIRHQARSQIVQRLLELDCEWDIDRATAAHFAFVGETDDPASLLRRMGFRSRREIEEEKDLIYSFLDDKKAA